MSLSTISTTTIFTSTLQPTIRIADDRIISISIDGSANILFNDFYGHFQEETGDIIFQPNYNLNLGLHRLKVETTSSTFEYIFNVAYFDEFEEIKTSRWRLPKDSNANWFQSNGVNLIIEPKTSEAHSSLFFIKPIGESFVINFSIQPQGETLAIVPYVIDGVRYEFALDTNGSGRNSLFGSLDGSFDGKEYDFKPHVWYQIRIMKDTEHIALYVTELPNDESNPSLEINVFNEIFNETLSTSGEPYTFGLSSWQQSEGVIIGDIHIETL